MEIEIKTVELRVLRSAEGMWITNSDQTMFSKEIYLGSEDSSDNYHEITEERKQELEHKQQLESIRSAEELH